MEYQQEQNSSAGYRGFQFQKTTGKKFKHNGFIMIGTIIFMAFLSFLILSLLQQTIFLKHWKRIQHECRIINDKTQKQIISGFKELQSLNPQAQLLRKQEFNARRAVAMARDPYTLAIATAALSAVILKQSLFRAKQKSIILNTKLKAQYTLNTFSYGYKKTKVKFSLLPVPPTSLSPDYKTPIGLQYLQKIEVTWKFLFKNKKLQGQCGSTIEKNATFKTKLLYPEAASLRGLFF